MTWREAAEGGYDLFFNRDERNTRAPEGAPSLRATAGGVRYLAPEDGDHRGTWLMLNAHGLTVCVLNDYPRGVVENGKVSRGRLPPACTACAAAGDVIAVLRATALADYAPFHLVAVDAAGGAVHLRWDGRALHEASAPAFLTSSSFEPKRVRAARADKFAALPERSTEGLRAFHHAHDRSAGAESVLMRRPDAATRSVCAVRVRAAARELAYEPVVWDGTAAENPVVLHL